jgi:hypothetical protein
VILRALKDLKIVGKGEYGLIKDKNIKQRNMQISKAIHIKFTDGLIAKEEDTQLIVG